MIRLAGPNAFRDLRAVEVAGAVHAASLADARRSALARERDRCEEWLIHRVAPGLLDDRGSTLERSPRARARVNFAALMVKSG